MRYDDAGGLVFDDVHELAEGLVGNLGEEIEDEARACLEDMVAGNQGGELEEVGLQLEQELWDAEYGLDAETDLGDVDPDELAAAEARVRSTEAEGRLHDALDALEKEIGRPLTPAEEDRLITDELGDAALDGQEIDLVAEHAEALAGKIEDPEGRLEIGVAAAQRAKGDDEVDPDKIVREVADMSEGEQRIARGVGAAILAKDGLSYADFEAGDGGDVGQEADAVEHEAAVE